MRVLITTLLLMFTVIVINAEARVCEPQRACGNTISSKVTLKKFASYTAFDTWLVNNPYTDFEVLYSTASIINILIYADMKYTEQCWDYQGECTIQ